MWFNDNMQSDAGLESEQTKAFPIDFGNKTHNIHLQNPNVDNSAPRNVNGTCYITPHNFVIS